VAGRGAASSYGGASDDRVEFATGAFAQWRTLLGRELLSITRNPFDVAGRTLTFVGVGLLMGTLYYGLPVSVVSFGFEFEFARSGLGLSFALTVACCAVQSPRTLFAGGKKTSPPSPHPPQPPTPTPPPQFDADSSRNRLNLLFMLLCFYCLMPYITMGLYTADKKFYLSDASSQLYRPGAYYLAKVSAPRRNHLAAED